jgi:hypothetical protein
LTPPRRDPRYPDFPTIVHALADAAQRRPNAPGLACLDRELTYGQYAQAAATLRGPSPSAALPASGSPI